MQFAQLVIRSAAFLLVVGPAFAEDNPNVVIFDNAIDPAATEEILASASEQSAAEMLFAGWQASRQLYLDAVEAGADDAQIALLRSVELASASAYEAALIAQNTVQLASAAPVVLTDEMFVELIAPVAE